MKTILVTGVSGFIGSQLLLALCNKYGAKNIIAISSKINKFCKTITYKNNKFSLSEEEVSLVRNVELIIHAGAFIPKKASEANNILMCNGNITYTQNLLELPLNNLRKIIYISTTDVYESNDIISESTITNPSTMYGWSKLYCESMISSFAIEKSITKQILRLGHVYGPGEESFAKFIPRAIHSIQKNHSVELWGDGEDVRSFIFIEDVILSILKSIELNFDAGVINIAGSNAISIKSLLNILIELSDKNILVVRKDASVNTKHCIFNTSKLKKYLLESEIDLNDGLKIEFEYMQGLN